MSDSLDVLLCTDYLPPSDGGVEHVVDQLARRLAARGLSVGVFSLAEPGEAIDLSEHPEIELLTARRIDLTDYIGLQSSISPAALRAFKHVLDSYEPDIVHVHNRFFFSSFLGLLYAPVYGYALVTSLHLGSLDHLDGAGSLAASAFQSTFSKQLVGRSDALICVSSAVAEVATDLGGDPTRLHVLPNAVDCDRFAVQTPEFDKTLLYIGRLVTNNGPQDLVTAIPDILSAHPEATVHMVGSGTLQAELEAEIESRGIDESVTMHGYVEDITALYAEADVFCRPSYSEGLPLTLLESMATDTVPVVTPIAGSAEIVEDGTNGRLVGVGQPKEIASTVTELFDSPDRLTTMASTARSYVNSNHSWEKRTQNVIDVYDMVSNR